MPIDLSKLHPKAQQALKESLAPDETVQAYIIGGGKKAALIATDRRAFIFKTGVAAGATFGQKFGSFDYRNISGVQLHLGMLNGSVVLDIPGAAPVGSSYWGNGNNDPWKAQNAIPVSKSKNLEAVVSSIRRLIMDFHARMNAPVAPAPAPERDIAAQIEKLGELRDRGLVTPEEFEAKKTELLARL